MKKSAFKRIEQRIEFKRSVLAPSSHIPIVKINLGNKVKKETEVAILE